MKLDFSLLIVDDNPEGLQQAIRTLEEHLDSKGFSLSSRYLDEISEESLQELEKGKGKSFNLVMIDYNLGHDDIDGAQVARRLRVTLPYTDMVFYSGIPTRELQKELLEHGVSGVFVEERRYLSDPLKGIADTVIGKAVDLTLMRGIAMAEVAEMDIIMEKAIVFILNLNNPRVLRVERRTTEKLVKNMEGRSARLRGKLVDGLIPVVLDTGLFSSYDRYRAIVRMTKVVDADFEKEDTFLQSYKQDIIDNRNLLAHANEEFASDGQIILRPTRRGDVEVIDDEWMQSFRKKLRIHRRALEAICEVLRNELGSPSL